ncbi:hypothetical protein A2803_02085 [Candidatus Woesebacteria bacterium RIFCSPHIGHO2_01_FULL_44_21]|uniref:Transposase IS200-like domain-containing protein n=1 Tax=Candidatus Woesebacteria bacterium RIFCSPHIGHO2_01_FULL_44_21 TaxID=1802503 RepID=A0A1F7Z0S1_9BACT|nr:MAG: hypothetical protein A2803_02085 [Candidatus Woesebacteria bacterium RIFCSPHIGHO2_01_FULL_44_21]OGM70721.1 MAG: hypothetical protein A2897_00080 [Candidatus Woesebacteria bacterium RIFCSPLOWO2_01_FULL_44_24b]
MPAKHLSRVSSEGTYCHIYNKGVENRVIFKDNQDYDVFLGYLKEYLSPPLDPESTKKAFVVNGRTYRGMPHQPKNYFNKVELVAYSLKPDHFHLILHQRAKDAQASFLRSICTRYSMSFNKKHHRRGSLFDGPYKSIQVDDLSKLPYLSHYIYKHGEDKNDSNSNFSSYAEFIGERTTPWVKPEVATGKADDFKGFAEQYDPEHDERALNGLIFDEEVRVEPEPLGLEGRGLEPMEGKSFQAPQLEQTFEPKRKQNGSKLRMAQFLGATAIAYLILFTVSFRNVQTASSASQVAILSPVSSDSNLVPEVSGAQDEQPDTEPLTVRPKVKIIALEGLPVNLYLAAAETSEVIDQAMDGDIFELTQSNIPGWYRVLLGDGAAYVKVMYVQNIEGEE